ncbi:CLUMA_CG001145, isoform A [Clunio marinus]|uniref:CLUMA_CG001145, isoform A n=1 Tax=Clunio marinus TaxID=568069 RepID=A0A1J1HH45_9DIPT|nr:CLUMA_CG001145, isoform A [Clunio marinus]
MEKEKTTNLTRWNERMFIILYVKVDHWLKQIEKKQDFQQCLRARLYVLPYVRKVKKKVHQRLIMSVIKNPPNLNKTDPWSSSLERDCETRDFRYGMLTLFLHAQGGEYVSSILEIFHKTSTCFWHIKLHENSINEVAPCGEIKFEEKQILLHFYLKETFKRNQKKTKRTFLIRDALRDTAKRD